jgi:hypothetical protein
VGRNTLRPYIDHFLQCRRDYGGLEAFWGYDELGIDVPCPQVEARIETIYRRAKAVLTVQQGSDTVIIEYARDCGGDGPKSAAVRTWLYDRCICVNKDGPRYWLNRFRAIMMLNGSARGIDDPLLLLGECPTKKLNVVLNDLAELDVKTFSHIDELLAS